MKYEPLVSDRYYHIYNRGNNKEDIFFERKNYHFFLQLMKRHLVSVTNVYAYCLLKNHFHMLIKTKVLEEDKSISKAFSNFFNAYAKAMNKSYNRTGSLFQDRFARKLIENEDYLKKLVLYLHLNPEHHQLISNFKEYKYSSYLSILVNKPTQLSRRKFWICLKEEIILSILIILNKNYLRV